ncbi:hypothetical protein MAP00_004692 [Monascus purpureus]|nr:hypothetical protein MAP00_004692 [Monascus purpureus]
MRYHHASANQETETENLEQIIVCLLAGVGELDSVGELINWFQPAWGAKGEGQICYFYFLLSVQSFLFLFSVLSMSILYRECVCVLFIAFYDFIFLRFLLLWVLQL